MNRRLLLLLLALALFSVNVHSTHLVGGEIYYECKGNGNYQIVLIVYRDCLNGQAPFDANAPVTTYDMNGVKKRGDTFSFPGSKQINYFPSEPCYSYTSDLCVEEAIYKKTIPLPTITGGYHLTYQRCCRNHAITNLAAPNNEGATYTIHITEEALNLCNSSPHFGNFPPMAICIGTEASIDYSAIDPDGDSLVYEFYTPLHGGGTSNTNPTGFNGPTPSPAAPPPYTDVVWKNGYSKNYQVDAVPPFSIDSKTGLITGTPAQLGQYVLGVQVKEYRDGVLLSVVKRDFQFQTVVCHKSTTADIEGQVYPCSGNEVDFTNLSTNSTSYLWNFGVPGITSDTSTLTNPSYVYPDTGIYIVSLVTFPGYSCSDTTLDTFLVYPLLKADFTTPDTQCITNNSYDFFSDGIFSPKATFQWDFGSRSQPKTDTAKNPVGIHFTDVGQQKIKLIISENGCESIVYKDVFVYPHPIPKFTVEEQPNCSPYRINIENFSEAWTPMTYVWDFGNGDSSNSPTPTYIYVDSGSFTISSTVITNNGCADTVHSDSPVTIKVTPTPTASFSVSPKETSIYFPSITFNSQTEKGLNCEIYVNNELLDFCSGKMNFEEFGIYKVTQIVTNDFGCTDTLSDYFQVTDEFAFFAPNAFTPNGDGLNDTYTPIIYGVLTYKFSVYDKYGHEVFSSTLPGEGWDGSISDKIAAQMEQYNYRVEAIDYLGNNRLFIGNLFIVR